ncbi:MAG: aminopeptidase N [Nocardioidaceae bacterium]
MEHVRSLTRTEAQERADLVRVVRYDIEVDMTGLADGDALHARSTITFTSNTPGGETFVDCVAEVRSATLNGSPVPAAQVGEGRIRLTDLAAENVLVVESVQTDTASASGILRSVDPKDGEVYVWTSFEPDDARRCWACFDQPDLKAPHAFTVLAPEPWTVLSNRAVDTVHDTGTAGVRRWVFPDTPPLSTYVVVVNAGPFHELRSHRGGHDLGLLCRKSLAPFLERDAEELFALTADGLAFFGEHFGQPFGQERYDQVFVPDMAGAMENWGSVTWGDSYLYRGEPTRRQLAVRADVLLHEMAHMWFGDLVTMRWWEDLWLNEAFASWAALWASANASEFTEAYASFLSCEETDGYKADAAITTHPIRQPVDDVDAATASFDAITYVKGCAVLRQLAAYVGEDTFVAGLRAYFAEHAWGNTTLDDLMRAVGDAAGRDLSGWTTAWLDRAGADRIELERTDGGWVLHAAAPDGGPARPHALAIGVYDRTAGGGWERTALVPVETAGARTEVPAGVDGELLLVNDEDLTFARTRPDHDSLRLMLTEVAGLPSTMARSLAVATAWDMLTWAEIGAADVVRCVVAALGAETEPAAAQDMLRLGLDAAQDWSSDVDRDNLFAALADAASELAAHGQPELRLPALLALSRCASSDAHLAQLEQAAVDDVNVAWRLQIRLAELGRVDEAALADLVVRDPDPDAGIRTLAVRAALPDREAKEAAWQAAFVDRSVPTGRLFELAESFWQRGQEDLLREFQGRYLTEITGAGGGLLALGYLARVFYPLAVADADYVAVTEKAAAAEGLNAAVHKTLRSCADTLQKMLRARAS